MTTALRRQPPETPRDRIARLAQQIHTPPIIHKFWRELLTVEQRNDQAQGNQQDHQIAVIWSNLKQIPLDHAVVDLAEEFCLVYPREARFLRREIGATPNHPSGPANTPETRLPLRDDGVQPAADSLGPSRRGLGAIASLTPENESNPTHPIGPANSPETLLHLGEDGVLKLRGAEICTIKLCKRPSKLELLLRGFEDAGWPPSIPDPCARTNQNVSRAIDDAHRKQTAIRFSKLRDNVYWRENL